MKKGMGMKILASLALFAIFASIVAVGIMSLMTTNTQPIKKVEEITSKKINVSNIKMTTSSGETIKMGETTNSGVLVK